MRSAQIWRKRDFNRFKSRTAGFTLIELMIVVLIIAVLTVIAIPNYQRLVRRSKEGSVRSNIHVIQTGIEVFAIDHVAVYPQPADDAELQSLLPGGTYPTNPFTRAATAVLWNADPVNPGEIGIANLPGGGYSLKGHGQLAMLTPFVVVGD
ncbi:MAG: prepilin-type N-terminal cleavage/methylation domain-containing protein [Candidatus Latescibacterota bacterium]|nr:MAG: prepilin-type N-terminal cleavage/methylation domain-containing protein [Candidatus Latescibacterota bacterium]